MLSPPPQAPLLQLPLLPLPLSRPAAHSPPPPLPPQPFPHHHPAARPPPPLPYRSSGGAAAAVEFVLRKLNISYQFVSRNRNEEEGILSYEDLNEDVLSECTVIINTTPLGTFPKVDDAAAIPYSLLTPKHYLFDLVYNPAETKFIRQGREQGAATENGYEMLVLQAEENWAIWNRK